MQTTRAAVLSLSLLAGGLIAASSPVNAQSTQLTVPTLTGNLINFPDAPAAPSFGNPNPSPVPVASGFTATGNGYTLTFTDTLNTNTAPGNGDFQVDSTAAGFSNINPITSGFIFPEGTVLLDNGVANTDSTFSVDGPDKIQFSQGVPWFSLYAFDDTNSQNFEFQVFDGATSLGDYTASGATAFSPVFLGAQAKPGFAITSVVISDPSSSATQSPFAITGVTTVPEPSAAAVFGLGITLGALRLLMRRRRTA